MNRKKGTVLVYVMITSVVLAVLIVSVYTLVLSAINFSVAGKDSRQAYLNAKSGVEYAKSVLSVYNKVPLPSPLPAFTDFSVYGDYNDGFTYEAEIITDPQTDIFVVCDVFDETSEGCSFQITSYGREGKSIKKIIYGDDDPTTNDGELALPRSGTETEFIPPAEGSENTVRAGQYYIEYYDFETHSFDFIGLVWDFITGDFVMHEGIGWYKLKNYDNFFDINSWYNEMGDSDSNKIIEEKALLYSTIPLSRKPDTNTSFTAGEMYFRNFRAAYRNVYGNTDLRLCSNFFYFDNDIINNNNNSNIYLYTRKCTVNGQSVTLPNALNNQPGVIYLSGNWHENSLAGSDIYGTDGVDIIKNGVIKHTAGEEGSYYLFENGANLSSYEHIWPVTKEQADAALEQLGLNIKEIEGTIAYINANYK